MPDRTEAAEDVQAKRHEFNDRLFCENCGVDAISLQGCGKNAMNCPFDKHEALANA